MSKKKLKPTPLIKSCEHSPIFLNPEAVIPVRHEVLRKGKPIETAFFDGDATADAFHLGIYHYNQIVAVASYLPNKHAYFKEEWKQYQLRGMAVLPEYRGQDFGKKMYLKALEILKERNTNVLWFNARVVAWPFYEKLGAQKLGTPFFIDGIGDHSLMFQEIS